MIGDETAHPAVARCAVVDNCLAIGGIPVTRLAQRVGRTPFFAYDRGRIIARIAELRAALPPMVHLHYAIKANPMPAVVQCLTALVDGFDVASAQEMSIALDTPMPADRISFAGPGKRTAELAQALAAGVVIHLESAREMRDLASLAQAEGAKPKVAIRVNPNFELRGSGMRMGGGAQQFGVDAEAVPQMLHELATLPLEFAGFHIFAGSQNLSVEFHQQAQARLIDLAIELTRHAPSPVKYLNIGGGFGIPYFPNDKPLDIGAVGRTLGELIQQRLRPALPAVQVVVELGRYIVGEAGFYITRIIDRKESRGQVFLVVDGGLHHHLSASGNFGQVIRRNYPLVIANRITRVSDETASVVGCLCTPIDLLGDKVRLPRAEIGDLVAILQSGAYGPSASPADFLSHPHPAEIVV